MKKIEIHLSLCQCLSVIPPVASSALPRALLPEIFNLCKT